MGVTTDNGNVILDVHGLAVVDPVGLETSFIQCPERQQGTARADEEGLRAVEPVHARVRNRRIGTTPRGRGLLATPKGAEHRSAIESVEAGSGTRGRHLHCAFGAAGKTRLIRINVP